jgi:aspartate 1-decarboxylase
MIKILKSKLTAKVIEANLDYEGSITISEDLMDMLQLTKYEEVDVNNKSNPNAPRIRTYVIPGPRGEAYIGLNGAAAHHFAPGDEVHILSWLYEPSPRMVSPFVLDLTNKKNEHFGRIIENDGPAFP